MRKIFQQLALVSLITLAVVTAPLINAGTAHIASAQTATPQCWQSNGAPISLDIITNQAQCVSPNIWSATAPTTNYTLGGGQAPQQQAAQQTTPTSCDIFDNPIKCITYGLMDSVG